MFVLNLAMVRLRKRDALRNVELFWLKTLKETQPSTHTWQGKLWRKYLLIRQNKPRIEMARCFGQS